MGSIFAAELLRYILKKLKASAHSFKRFTSSPFKKLSFSLYAPIMSDECHA